MVAKDSGEMEPQIKAPGVAPLEVASTYAYEMKPQMNTDERRLNVLSEQILGAAFEVSNVIGAGFLEKVYENALNVELNLRGLKTFQQAPLKVFYKDELVGDYIADILVENEIIIEVKAVKELDTVHFAQCLNYLRITGLKLCLLLNFCKTKVEIKRIVNGI